MSGVLDGGPLVGGAAAAGGGVSASNFDISAATLSSDGILTSSSVSGAGAISASFDQDASSTSRNLSSCGYRAYALPQAPSAGGVYRIVMSGLSLTDKSWIGAGLMSASGPATFAKGARLADPNGTTNIGLYELDGVSTSLISGGSPNVDRMTLTYAVTDDGTIQDCIVTAEEADGTPVARGTISFSQSLSGLLWFTAWGNQDTDGTPETATAAATVTCHAVDDP